MSKDKAPGEPKDNRPQCPYCGSRAVRFRSTKPLPFICVRCGKEWA